MALANVAAWFRLQGVNVVMIDWDLEAPGLESFFATDSADFEAMRAKLGLIDVIATYKELFPSLPRPMARPADAREGRRVALRPFISILNDALPPIAHTLIPIRAPSSEVAGRLSLLSAGCRSESRFDGYAQTVQQFDWEEFYAKYEGEAYFEWLRGQLLSGDVADIVLIDSRTGVAEMSGVCTRQLADVVVMLSAPNDQNLNGVAAMAKSFTRDDVVAARDGRSIELLPVPARVDISEGRPVDLFETRFREKLAPFVPDMFRRIDRSRTRLRIPYIREYAYVERLAIGDPQGVKSLQQAYEALAAHIVALSPADSIIKRQCRGVLQQTFGLPTVFVTSLDTQALTFASRLRMRLDRAGVVAVDANDKPEPALETARATAQTSSASSTVVLAVSADNRFDARVRDLSRRAREQGISLIVVSEGTPTPTGDAPRWARRVQMFAVDTDWDELCRVLQTPLRATRVPLMAPPIRPGFVNRAREIAELKSRLLGETADRRQIALVGLGGMGKSALARVVCHDDDVIESFEDGILWMTLGTQPDLLRAAGTVLSAFGDASRVEQIDDAEKRLAEHLSSKRCLVVVDDVADAAHLRMFSRLGPACRMLITTRFQSIAAELGAEVLNLDPLPTNDAVNWISQEGVQSEMAQALTAKLGNVPLALELTQQVLRRGVPLPDLLRRLDDEGLTALDAGTSRDPATSLFASLMVAVEALPADDRARLPAVATLPSAELVEMSRFAEATGLSLREADAMARRLGAVSLAEYSVEGVRLVEPVHGFLRSLKVRQERAEATRLVPEQGTSGSIWISYRRADSAGYAGRLYDRLASKLGFDRVLLDVDSITVGMDFVEAIEKRIRQLSAMLVVIGPGWVSAADSSGKRRLDDPDDFVRREIEIALETHIPVIPVLVGGAYMPLASELPARLQSLARRNALELSDISFQQDVDRLLSALESLVSRPAEVEAQRVPPPAGPSSSAIEIRAGARTELARKSTALRPGRTLWIVGGLALAGVVFWMLWSSGGWRPGQGNPPVESVQTAPPSNGGPEVSSQARANFEQAEAYSLGRNVPQNYARAAELYESAARLGFAPAQNALGRLYENGLGVQKDRERAIHWYRLAAIAGHPDAKEALQRLRATPSR